MKKALFDTVAIMPYSSGTVIDRRGYESAVLALTVAASQTATVKIEHCDTEDGTFEVVQDERVFVDNPLTETGEASIKNDTEDEILANLDVDLIGCKAFIKMTVTTGTAGALALGDATDYPVKYPACDSEKDGD